MNTASPAIYHDLQSLTDLKADARQAKNGSLREATAQFEGIFFQMMLKSMRDATVKSDLFDSDQMETYQQMFDQQLSLDLSHQGGLGLADILMQQLSPQTTTRAAANEDRPMTSALPGGLPRSIPSSVRPQSSRAAQPAVVTGADQATAVASQAQTGLSPATPADFIRQVWDKAVSAARELAVDPAVLVAQSALETGWGKKMIHRSDGQNSLNLFGIKAQAGWQGRSAAVNTLEYRGGVAELRRDNFRAYESVADSFADYVALIKGSPRYQTALSAGTDNQAFVRGLQDAGYATDPDYADKILAILGDDRYSSIMRELKNSSDLPLSV